MLENNVKPIVNTNIFTTMDDHIIKTIIKKKPESWTIKDLQKALPYNHTAQNIKDHILYNFISKEELQKHLTSDIKLDNELSKLDAIIIKYFPYLGGNYRNWASFIKDKINETVTANQIKLRAKELNISYTGS